MRRTLLILLAPLLLTGCVVYGSGETVGYVYAVDDGILWDKVWYRTSLDSSQSDCYLVKNDAIKQQLSELAGKSKVKLSYNRHLFTFSSCETVGDKVRGSKDEIVGFEILP